MSRKRRVFDINIPEDVPVGKVPDRVLSGRRGPMASAISENADALRDRKAAEAEIRNENDRLAAEFVRLKREGLIVDRIALDDVVTDKLIRDRRPQDDDELEELKQSIQDIGLSNPIRVELREDGKFELIQGMRRWLAFQALRDSGAGGDYDTIPAGIEPGGAPAIDAYRRMVDENLIRKNISFSEMATLARRYADDPANDCSDAAEAVSLLFKSASYVKRSYIRAFAELLVQLEKVLEHPEAIPRNVGVDLKRRIEAEPSLVADVTQALRAAPGRDSAQEVEILRGFANAAADTLPTGKTAGRKPAKARKAKTTFQVPLPDGVAKCSASQGRLELRHDADFSAMDRVALERAVAAFFAALDQQ
ncbi:MAG: ParB N-terminal domain-containing protein [Marinibacterium sp.]|nr:ParB N-terminal domain-containing protein [Marinibacterium sp.]